MSRSTGRRETHFGFTLIELLVVIGIIAILVGILLPVASMVRKKSQQAATAAQITKLAQAINNYYSDFKAYPGPVPETADIYGYQGNKTGLMPTIPAASSTPTSQTITNLTSSENLVLGLLGGLVNVNGTIQFNVSMIGSGPQSLNALSPQQFSPYCDVNLTTDLTSDPTYGYNSWTSTWTTYPKGTLPALVVPELLDQFSTQHPIIYLRAQNGVRNAIVDGWTTNAAGPVQASNGTTSQYWSQEMAPYWWGAQTPNTVGPTYGVVFPSQGDPNNGNSSLYPNAASAGGGLPFFASSSIIGTARAQDGFILVSAGYDGVYGTSDDVVYPPN